MGKRSDLKGRYGGENRTDIQNRNSLVDETREGELRVRVKKSSL